MSLREEQCKKVCRILGDVLANRPTERDSLIVAVRKAFKALEEPHWIPCSERLPEEGQEILATTTDNAWGDVVIVRTYYKEMHKSVIAWMPLPEHYKGVTE